MWPVLDVASDSSGSGGLFITRPAKPSRFGDPSLHDHAEESLQPIGFLGRLLPADAMDAWEAHGHARFMPARAMHRVEGNLEHKPRLDLAHGTETVHGVIAHESVELPQLQIGEAEIGLAHGHEL